MGLRKMLASATANMKMAAQEANIIATPCFWKKVRLLPTLFRTYTSLYPSIFANTIGSGWLLHEHFYGMGDTIAQLSFVFIGK